MSKTTVYDVSTGKYEIMEVEDTPIIEDKQIEQPKTEIELLREEVQSLKQDVQELNELKESVNTMLIQIENINK